MAQDWTRIEGMIIGHELDPSAVAGELKERGVTVGFDELARVPTLSAWWTLIDEKRLAA